MSGNYLSLGKLCEIFQESPSRIHKRLAAAGIQQAFSINSIDHYSDEVIEKLKSTETEIQTGKAGEMIHT